MQEKKERDWVVMDAKNRRHQLRKRERITRKCYKEMCQKK